METTKLYYEDAYLREFDAAVLSCREEQGRYLVVLDRTAFYPEGGGQPADHGVLGGVAVTDVQERDGVVCHTCAGPLAVGSTVHGAIDWQRRFDHMQQHSGEHIVSGMLCSAFHCDNVGFHPLGAGTGGGAAGQPIYLGGSSLPGDVPLPGGAGGPPLPQQKGPDGDGAADGVSGGGSMRLLRHPCLRQRTGGAGEIPLLPEAPGGGAAGAGVRRPGHGPPVPQLAAEPVHRTAAVGRQGREVLSLKARCAGLEEELFRLLAEQYRDAGEVLLVRHDLAGDGARRLCDAVSHTCGGRCAVFSGEGERYQYAVIHPGADLREFVKHMNDTLHGRGGGRSGFAQGSVAADEETIRAFFRGV